MDAPRTAPASFEIIRQSIEALRSDLDRLGVAHIAIFGSYALDRQRPDSDVDLIIDLRPGHGYFELGEIKAILESEIGSEVNPVLASGVPGDSLIRKEAVDVF